MESHPAVPVVKAGLRHEVMHSTVLATGQFPLGNPTVENSVNRVHNQRGSPNGGRIPAPSVHTSHIPPSQTLGPTSLDMHMGPTPIKNTAKDRDATSTCKVSASTKK